MGAGLRTDDIIEITQLYARYAHAVDDGDGKAFAHCFVADGALNVGHGEPITGRETLEGFASALPSQLPGIRHVVTNILLDGDGDEATGAAYLTVYVGGAQPKLVMTGRYRDQLRRDGGSWAFVRRDLTPDA
jgi:uncharacterized protein (TIGR02246 family)